ncbi:MAG: Nif3-like dinuclear metal center hexameric protein [Gammaproteobacteria bacterium]
MAALQDIVDYCDALLEPWRFQDYCPNGLQVEGRERVARIVCGVTASQALLDAALAEGADAVLVHHGYFWRGEDPTLRGIKRARLATLLNNDISLIAYHLPLDAHPEVGNNAQLARRLGLEVLGTLNAEGVGSHGRLPGAVTPEGFASTLAGALDRTPLHIEGGPASIRTVGWCTGAAQGYIEQAVALGLDAFVSGEISEQTVHVAREAGIHYFAAGHHATERYGVQALSGRLAGEFGVDWEFVEIPNPV